jgi:hypothetical protein
VVCIKDAEPGSITPRAGVYRQGAEPDTFDALGHHLQVDWAQKPTRYIRRIAVSQLDPPGEEDVKRAFEPRDASDPA